MVRTVLNTLAQTGTQYEHASIALTARFTEATAE
jgi:hypothetical protein